MQQQSFEIGDISPRQYFAAVALLLAFLFAFIENSNQLPFWLNSLLWLFQSVVPMSLMVISHKFASRFSRFNRLNPWGRLLLSGCVGALLFVPLALAADILLGNDPLPTQISDFGYALMDETGGVMPPVVLCWMAINAPWILGFKIIQTQTHLDANPAAPIPIAAATHTPAEQQRDELAIQPPKLKTPDALLCLLPREKQGDILYLKSELHYLMVVTTAGQALILANLKDAIAACSAIPGIQPHRSFWVSQAAIRAFRRQGREGTLILCNQAEIPVSRNKLNATAQLCTEILQVSH